VVKKRTPPRKSSPKKRTKKTARPARKTAGTKARPAGRGIDFNPVKERLRAHIRKLELQLGGAEARAAALDPAPWDTLDKLHRLNSLMSEVCQPTMVIGS
jgi:hypothetical protein